MTVLVTGGAGYIGGHMVLTLRDRGEQVVVLDDLSTGFRHALPPDVPLVVGDVGEIDLVRQTIHAHGVDAVAHFAAKIVVPESMTDPLSYYLNNTVKSRDLLEAVIAGGVRAFLFSSTAAVYGNASQHPISEDDEPRPLSPYGASKLMTERMVQDVSRAGPLRHVILRYFNVAGADPAGRLGQSTPEATHLIKAAMQAALGRRPRLEVFGDDYPTPDGTCVRDYIHVTDLVDAHVAALEHLRGGGGSLLLNCGYGRGYSVSEVVEAVRRVTGLPFEAKIAPRRPGDPAAIVAASDRIRTTLGWMPRLDDLHLIVEHAFAWERRLSEG
jgi:UDP-glucose 4-epimerase